MMIPAQLLWNVKVDLKQKIGLFVIFSLTLITMVFSIVRVEVSLRGPREDDLFYFLCATIELTVGKYSFPPKGLYPAPRCETNLRFMSTRQRF